MVAADLVEARRRLRLERYCTLADVGMDGDYVSPLQIVAHSPTGPVLLGYHWFDPGSVIKNYEVLRRLGYLPHILFNKVVERAFEICGMTRANFYMTQVFHLLPSGRSSGVPVRHLDYSFQSVTQHELQGRKIVALGAAVRETCERNGVKPHQVVDHPSARGPGRTIENKARQLADAIRRCDERCAT